MPGLLKSASYGRGAFKRTKLGFTGKQFSTGLKFPPGLTFYKDFRSAVKLSLHANFSLGSPRFTFTSTNGLFTITSAGYQATTANDEVLTYLIDKNRTAAQETIVIKFTLSTVGGTGFFFDSDDDRRVAYRPVGDPLKFTYYPNFTKNNLIKAVGADLAANTTYTIAVVTQHASPYINIFHNGTSEGTYTTGDYTTNAMGTLFYIGCRNDGTSQMLGTVKSTAYFNRALSASEVSAVYNIIK